MGLLIYATDRTDVRDVFRRRRVKKVLRPMSWGEISQLKGQAIPLILPGEQRLDDIALAMAGQHQVANASLAIIASLLLQKIILK